MEHSHRSADSRFAAAEALIADLMERRERGEAAELSACIAAHPELATELGELGQELGLLARVLDVEGKRSAEQRAEVQKILAELSALGGFQDRYRLEAEVGQGGMGIVYRVRDTRLDRALALKVIRGQVSATPSGTTPPIAPRQLVRFLNEAKITGQLDHPGIVPVHEVGVDQEGRAYFTMKLVNGRTLGDLFRLRAEGDAQWTTARLLGVIGRVCEAVAFAHERGVIHRDLKPANVMVGDFGEVYVMDWGLARRLGDASGSAHDESTAVAVIDEELSLQASLTRDGDRVGTPAYMSPEQARGEIAAMGPWSDVYSVGAMLYELISELPPYLQRGERASGSQILARVVSGPPPALVAPKTSPELLAICEKAMRREQGDRYASMRELSQELERFLAGRTVRAFKTGGWIEARKWVQRNRALAGALMAVLVVSVGGGVAYAIKAKAAEASATQAQQRAEENKRLAEEKVQFAAAAAERAAAAEKAEKAERERADQLKQVSDFQSQMLDQIDVTVAGLGLMKDLRERFTLALEKAGVPELERERRTEAFGMELSRVNATDAAAGIIDRTILTPAVKAIDARFQDDPKTDAQLRRVLGLLYMKVGLYEEANPLLVSALDIRRREGGEDHTDTLTSTSDLGVLLEAQGKLADAEVYLLEALEKTRRVLGEQHPDTLTSIANMGNLLIAQGKLVEAEPYLREAMQKMRSLLGEEHPRTQSCIESMGALFRSQGKLAEAEPYMREVLGRRRRMLGDDHPDTLACIGNVGILLHDQGKLAAAEVYLREVLERSRRVLGEEHPRTLNCINSMGTLLKAQGKFVEAEPHVREAMEKSRRVLGELHPNTLNCVNNMGLFLQAQGKLSDAESYLQEALEKFRSVLGEVHQNTLTALGNMGMLLEAQGRLTEAEPYLREALEKSRNVLGGEHPSSLICVNNMGYLLQAQGRLAEAEPYLREALDKRRRVLGEEHPSTLNSMGNLGNLFHAQGKLAEAEQCWRETMERSRRVLGEAHLETLIATNNLGHLLQAQGKVAEAESCWREALEKSRCILGEEHPRTLAIINMMVVVLCSQGKLVEAEPYMREVLDRCRRLLGDEHPDTLTCIGNMGMLLHDQGKLAEAEPYLREAVALRRRVLGEEHPDAVVSSGNLGMLLDAQGNHREAIDLLSRAEPAARKVYGGEGAPRLASFIATLGRARVGLGYDAERFVLAEANLLEAHPIYVDTRGETHRDTVGCVQTLVDLYTVWHNAEPGSGHDAKAAKWQAKLDAAKAGSAKDTASQKK